MEIGLRTNGFNKSHRLADQCVPLRSPVAHVPAPLKPSLAGRARYCHLRCQPLWIASNCRQPQENEYRPAPHGFIYPATQDSAQGVLVHHRTQRGPSALSKPLISAEGIMETHDPVEALKLIRKLALAAIGSNELGYLKTTMRDVLVIIDRALPTVKRDQLRGH
jgi:hypothetical protein